MNFVKVNLNDSQKKKLRDAQKKGINFAVKLAFDKLEGNDLDSVEKLINIELKDYFHDHKPYITGLSIPPKMNVIRRMDIERIVYSISHGVDCTFEKITLRLKKDDPVDLPEYILGQGEKATHICHFSN